jgi:hypothetical protein
MISRLIGNLSYHTLHDFSPCLPCRIGCDNLSKVGNIVDTIFTYGFFHNGAFVCSVFLFPALRRARFNSVKFFNNLAYYNIV